jgi:hypothetical protein
VFYEEVAVELQKANNLRPSRVHCKDDIVKNQDGIPYGSLDSVDSVLLVRKGLGNDEVSYSEDQGSEGIEEEVISDSKLKG